MAEKFINIYRGDMLVFGTFTYFVTLEATFENRDGPTLGTPIYVVQTCIFA